MGEWKGQWDRQGSAEMGKTTRRGGVKVRGMKCWINCNGPVNGGTAE
jgi:hypothetical protein